MARWEGSLGEGSEDRDSHQQEGGAGTNATGVWTHTLGVSVSGTAGTSAWFFIF